MRYCIRLLLGIYSPSALAAGKPRELALVWFVYRLSKRFRLYRFLFGPPSTDMLAHYTLHASIGVGKFSRNGTPSHPNASQVDDS